MRALIFSILCCACGASSSEEMPDASVHGSSDATPSSSGFTLNLGSDYTSSKPVTISAVKTNGVYAGYFEAHSDAATVPDLSVSIHASNASLSSGMQVPCARSTSSSSFNETSALIHWLDGHTYYTNLTATASCTITITAASQTSVSATITGTIYDETDSEHPGKAFTASFVAAVH
jgi:hypothetical protein